jgi:cell division protein ZapB
LTSHDFSTKIARMTELENLEQKLTQLVDLHQQARGEARDLRNRVAQLESENRALAGKVNAARGQLEALIERIPADEEA